MTALQTPLTTAAVYVQRWIDGDTVDVRAQREFESWPGEHLTLARDMRIRLAIIDTPERGQPGFREATAAAANWLPPGSIRTAYLYNLDRSGRWVADILVYPTGTDTISSYLLRDGYAKVWGSK